MRRICYKLTWCHARRRDISTQSFGKIKDTKLRILLVPQLLHSTRSATKARQIRPKKYWQAIWRVRFSLLTLNPPNLPRRPALAPRVKIRLSHVAYRELASSQPKPESKQHSNLTCTKLMSLTTEIGKFFSRWIKIWWRQDQSEFSNSLSATKNKKMSHQFWLVISSAITVLQRKTGAKSANVQSSN